MYEITAMLDMFPRLSVAVASTALSVAAITATQAHASPITYDFKVNVTQGSLAGKSFSGVFSYDDSTLKGIGAEELGVAEGLTVCMNFLGRNYKETDDSSYPTFPKLVFEDGKIKRLDFWIEPGKRVVWWTLPGWKVNLSLRPSSSSGFSSIPVNSSSATCPN